MAAILVLAELVQGAALPRERQRVGDAVGAEADEDDEGKRVMQSSEPPTRSRLKASVEAARITGGDLRAAFVPDASASDEWRKLAGWSEPKLQPCEDCRGRPNEVCWTGVTCGLGDKVIKVDLSH